MWSPVKQLLRVAHPATSKKRLLAVLIAYFDESGKPDHSPVVSLGAFVALDRKWNNFEFEWMRELRRAKAPIHPIYKLPYFHMTDFESPHCKDYRHLSSNKRIQFISNLARIVNKTVVFGSVHALVVKDWEEIIVPHLSKYKQARGWYIFLLQNILVDIVKWAKIPTGESIACVFDTNNEVSYFAKQHFEGLKEFWSWQNIFGSATYDNSVKFCPLQAADMLAYEGRKDVHNKMIDGGIRPMRKLLDRLTEKKRITVARYEREGLETFRDHFMGFREFQKQLEMDNE